MSLTKVTYSMIRGTSANVLDFGAVGDGINDDTQAIQNALDSGAKSVFIPEGIYFVSTLNVPNTVKQLYGIGGNRSNGSVIKFGYGNQTLDNGLLIENSNAGFVCSDLSITFPSGSYTNGIYVDHDNHFHTWTNVTTDDSSVVGSFHVANHWRLAANCWSNVFIHCGAWGSNNTNTIGFYTGDSSNSIDFYSCRLLHCGIGLYLPGASQELITYHGGEIASNGLAGVHIGDTSGSTGAQLETLNFIGVYFEDQTNHIVQNMPDMKGLLIIGCRTSETAWSNLVNVQKATYGININGGTYIRAEGGTGYLIDGNEQTIVNAFVEVGHLIRVSPYTNMGAQQVWYRTNSVSDSPGQKSYEYMGIEAQEDFNTTDSYSGKRLKKYFANNASGVLHDKSFNMVWDGSIPSSGYSIWNTTEFQQGDICWNSSVVAGGAPGWICTTAGTPGTWKAMANVAS